MIFRHLQALIPLGISALAVTPLGASAQDFPAKPVTIVVPFAAGSGTDQTARLYGQAVAESLKVPVVIDNKGGANGFIAAQYVAKAVPDGYTVFMTTNTTQVANRTCSRRSRTTRSRISYR